MTGRKTAEIINTVNNDEDITNINYRIRRPI